jgi:hypothetical protein
MRDTIEMAREAGFMLVAERDPETGGWWECFDDEIKRLVALVRADERTANIACIGRIAAMVGDPIDQARLYQAMDVIRARGETK